MKNFFKKIIDWFKSRDEIKEPIVSYKVKESVTDNYNVLGEKISSNTRYFINLTVLWDDGYVYSCGLYISNDKSPDNRKIVQWNNENSSDITYFDEKEDAEKTLNDILTNPNNYILK